MKKKLIALFLVFAIILALPLTYSEAKEKLSAVKNFKATNVESETVTLSWKKVSKASGYQIQLKEDGESFFPEKTIKKASKTTYKCNELFSGEKYTFRIRAYKNTGKKKIYSAWKKITVKTKAGSSDTEQPATNTVQNNQNAIIDKSTETSTQTNSNTNTQTTTEAQSTTESQTTTPTTNTVYTTKTGKKYHSTRNCRGLNNANNIYEKSESDAINSGLTRCDLCY